MKKTLGIGLAGLLTIFSQNTNALEINVNGFPIPDKTNAQQVNVVVMEIDDENFVIVNEYLRPDGSGFVEFRVNDEKVESYGVFSNIDEDKPSDYLIQDSNCNGKFEIKYSGKDFDKLIPISDCYFKK